MLPGRAGVWAIVVAGGSGSRFGEPKHRQILGGKEVWQHSVDAFHSAGVDNIVVVGDVPDGVPSGEDRAASVRSGLSGVPDSAEWILVHDAARPLVTVVLIERVLQRLLIGDVDGVVPAVPVTDTIKQVSGESIERTVDRENLVSVQTPQAFPADVLREAHRFDHSKTTESKTTDDAGLVETVLRGSVVYVMGDQANIKITYREDVVLAEAYLLVGETDG